MAQVNQQGESSLLLMGCEEEALQAASRRTLPGSLQAGERIYRVEGGRADSFTHLFPGGCFALRQCPWSGFPSYPPSTSQTRRQHTGDQTMSAGAWP